MNGLECSTQLNLLIGPNFEMDRTNHAYFKMKIGLFAFLIASKPSKLTKLPLLSFET
jgi:hypothetical protein